MSLRRNRKSPSWAFEKHCPHKKSGDIHSYDDYWILLMLFSLVFKSFYWMLYFISNDKRSGKLAWWWPILSSVDRPRPGVGSMRRGVIVSIHKTSFHFFCLQTCARKLMFGHTPALTLAHPHPHTQTRPHPTHAQAHILTPKHPHPHTQTRTQNDFLASHQELSEQMTFQIKLWIVKACLNIKGGTAWQIFLKVQYLDIKLF